MIFISYAREDAENARKLYNRLLMEGHNPWFDEQCIQPGQDWEQTIETAIGKCKYFIALLSSYSLEKRGYVQKELKKGLDTLETIPFSQIFLIPVRVEQCYPKHPVLNRLHWVDLFPDWEVGFGKLNKVFAFIPEETSVADLTDTKWVAFDSDGERWEFILKKNGIVESTERDVILQNGKWRQAGSNFYMEFNNKFSQYRAVLVGNELTGEAQNIDGREWSWHATVL